MPHTSSRHEKEWHSPVRREADSAWEEEHSTRIDDLQSRLEKLSMPSHSPPRRAASPEPIDDHYYSQDSDPDPVPRRHQKASPAVSRDRDDYSISTRRRRDQKTRHNDSYESVDSAPSRSRSGPLKAYSYKDDPYDSGYGSHSSFRSPVYTSRRPGLTQSQSTGLRLANYGAKTEPRDYAYALPRSRTYDVPMTSTYGNYSSPLGAYGVELSPSGRARVVTRPY
ncbi:uncharacterized protein AB675_6713 [Cyphellophora attinorum]|uniref:Uncharacterized protein n=1 Tax=Cyphellophora attinorum TaxID=1664694 RepID=A0A0N1P0C2_9EURO|nr:uncharacterized protein AB675_6713 [Phialophora attinorum]KPI43330.1 hypothetical protein AB675_6713 [Phialophora attinorum]